MTGDNLNTYGMLFITIRVGEEVFFHDVQVVRNATQPVFLGWDFLGIHHSVIYQRESFETVELVCSSFVFTKCRSF